MAVTDFIRSADSVEEDTIVADIAGSESTQVLAGALLRYGQDLIEERIPLETC